MVFEDILVPIPEKKRITKYGSHTKNYVYEILARKGKDRKKDLTVCVGIAVSDTEMHPNDKYFEIHPEQEKKKPLEKTGDFDSQIHIGSSIVLRSSAARLGITGLLKEYFPGYDELIQTLIEYYMVERESAAQLYKYYLYDHYTELNYIPNETMLSRIFGEYLDHERITKFKNAWLKRRLDMDPEARIDIDFDSTNFNVSSKELEEAEYGHAKVKEGLPQINVAYYLERKSGLPVYYDIYYGSIIDMEHCKKAAEKLRSIQSDVKASFIMDRGYFSQSNLNYLEDNGFRYLCMGKETEPINELIVKTPTTAIMKAENRMYGHIYGLKKYGKVFKASSKEYNIYLYYDPSKPVDRLPELQDWVEYGCANIVGKRDKKHGIRNTYGKYIKMELDDNDVIISAVPNYAYLNKYRETCGYFWIISNEDLTAEEALNCYRHRDPVERAFRNIKTEADLSKMYVSSDHAFEAKSFLAFLTAVLRAEITLRLRPYFFQYSSETTQTVLKELEKIKAEQLTDKYFLRFELTSKQKQILSFYDVAKADVLEYVRKLNDTIESNKTGA